MKDYSLRPIAEDELERVQEIEARAHRSPWTLEHFKKELEKSFSHTWVLTDDETDEKLAGYIVFWTLGEDAEILNLVVDPKFQRKGFGNFILGKVISECVRLEAKSLKLDVRKSNNPAIQLYQNAGFTTGLVRKAFYSDGESAYHMSLDLSELNPTGEDLN